MHQKKMVLIPAALSCILFSINTNGQGLDNILLSQNSFCDARYSGMAGAGSALPGSILSTFINPAFLNIYQQSEPAKAATFGAGYAKDSIFELGIVPAGVSYYSGTIGSIGAVFRSMTSGEGRSLMETGTIYSGRMFPSSTSHGAVDWGVNIRYGRLEWKTDIIDTLNASVVNHAYLDDFYRTDSLISDSILDTFIYKSSGMIHQNNLVMDLGFFQKSFADHLDFGLVFSNLLGYRWTEVNPSKNTIVSSSSDTTTTPTTISDTTRYLWTNAITKSNDWTGLSHTVMTVGVTFTDWPLGDHITLTVPMDVGFYGLFDRSANHHYTFRVGLEALLYNQYFLRFGFARSPTSIPDNLEGVKNQNIFQGGGGFFMGPISINAYFGNISKNYWGLSATIDLPQGNNNTKKSGGLTGG